MAATGSFQDLISEKTPVLIDFFAEWCGPCKAMAPQLEQLKEQMGENLRIVKIDVDKNPKLASQLKVSGVPTLMLYQSGQSLWRQSGYMTAKQIQQVVAQKVK